MCTSQTETMHSISMEVVFVLVSHQLITSQMHSSWSLSSAQLIWPGSASVFMWEGEGCTGGSIPAHHQHRSFLYSSSSRPSKPEHLVSNRASIGWLCLACSLFSSSSWRKLSPRLNLPAKTAVPTTPTSQEGPWRRHRERRSACHGGCSSHLASADGKSRSSTELHVFRWCMLLVRARFY